MLAWSWYLHSIQIVHSTISKKIFSTMWSLRWRRYVLSECSRFHVGGGSIGEQRGHVPPHPSNPLYFFQALTWISVQLKIPSRPTVFLLRIWLPFAASLYNNAPLSSPWIPWCLSPFRNPGYAPVSCRFNNDWMLHTTMVKLSTSPQMYVCTTG